MWQNILECFGHAPYHCVPVSRHYSNFTKNKPVASRYGLCQFCWQIWLRHTWPLLISTKTCYAGLWKGLVFIELRQTCIHSWPAIGVVIGQSLNAWVVMFTNSRFRCSEVAQKLCIYYSAHQIERGDKTQQQHSNKVGMSFSLGGGEHKPKPTPMILYSYLKYYFARHRELS